MGGVYEFQIKFSRCVVMVYLCCEWVDLHFRLEILRQVFLILTGAVKSSEGAYEEAMKVQCTFFKFLTSKLSIF